MKKKVISMLSIIVMLFGIITVSQKALAENKKVDVHITNLSVTNTQGVVPPDGFKVGTLFKLNASFDASKFGDTLNAGDFFEMQLPKQFKFPTNASSCNFNLFTKDGQVLAKAVVSPNSSGGGKIRVTFTNYVKGKHNIKGNFNLTANWNTVSYPVNQPGEYDIVIGSFIKRIKIEPNQPSPPSSTILSKYSGQTLTQDGHVRWHIIVNTKLQDLKGVVVKDQLSAEPPDNTGDITYVEDSFILYELVFNGSYWARKNPKNVSDKVTLSSDKKSFSYNLGDTNGKAYLLFYKSTYRDGLKLTNKAELTSASTSRIVTSHFVHSSSGGNGQADPMKTEVEVLKIWKDNDNKDKKRPQSIIVRLFADGKDTGQKRTLSSLDNWQGRFIDLPKYTKDGEVIKYTVKEDPTIKTYKDTVTGNDKTGFKITNTYTPPEKPPVVEKPSEPNKPPQTGDARNLIRYLAILMASGMFLLAGVLYKKLIG